MQYCVVVVWTALKCISSGISGFLLSPKSMELNWLCYTVLSYEYKYTLWLKVCGQLTIHPTCVF